MIDLLVAGAGPAGLATALYAARAGLEVTVVDPRSGPIDKACGEGLMPGAVRALAELDVHPPGRPFRGIGYYAAGAQAHALFRAGPGLGVRRTALQTCLLRSTLAAGITVLPRTVGPVEQDERSVTAAGVTARYLVAADGLHSPIARSLGLDQPAPGSRPRWGQRRHYRIAPWSDLVQVHWSDRAEAYVTPVGPDQVGVAILSSDRASFDDHLAKFPQLREQVAGADAGGVRGAGPLRRRTSRRVAGRVLLVGDAAGYVDALTGEGIAVSLACSRSLVGCLVAGAPDTNEAAWRTQSRRYRTLTAALLWATGRPVLRRAIVPLAHRAPWLFSAAVQQLAR
jgi:flavin-dependent dehydrogenase